MDRKEIYDRLAQAYNEASGGFAGQDNQVKDVLIALSFLIIGQSKTIDKDRLNETLMEWRRVLFCAIDDN